MVPQTSDGRVCRDSMARSHTGRNHRHPDPNCMLEPVAMEHEIEFILTAGPVQRKQTYVMMC